MNASVEAVVLEPPGNHDASIIWMHGLGADGHDFETIVPEFKLPADNGVRFIFPHAPMRPITINAGITMRGWYDIKELSKNREEDVAGIKESSVMITGLMDAERDKGIPSTRILLAGFSQGGAIALYCGLRYRQPLAGIIALSTYLALADELANEAVSENRGTEIFMGHGSTDPLIVLEQGELSRDRLLATGYKVDWHAYPMPHSVSAQEIADVAGFIRGKLEL